MVISCQNWSIETGFTNARHIQSDTDLDNIREEPAFKELLKELIKRDKGNMLEWLDDYDKALAKAKEEGKYVLIFFTAGSG